MDGLTPLEIAVGAPLGFESVEGRRRGSGRSLRRALEDACLPALEHPPARVAFSGGRDSSLVLAAATSAARQHGLALPIPVSLRFSGAPAAHESDWQELVVRHLELEDWVRLEFGDELDCLGPLATELLLRDGVRFPPNGQLLVPVIRVGTGGSLMTGLGGDELFGIWRWRANADVLARRRRLQRVAVRGLLLAIAPRRLRRWIVHQRQGWTPPWLTRAGAREYSRRAVLELDHPTRYDRYVEWVLGTRHLRLSIRRARDLAYSEGVSACAPLLDPLFTSTLAAEGRRFGLGDRAGTVAAVADGMLPELLTARSRKARFDEVFVGPEIRAFAERWQGGGVDPELVDLDALRTVWLDPAPGVFRSMLAIQAAWVAECSADRLPPVNHGRCRAGQAVDRADRSRGNAAI